LINIKLNRNFTYIDLFAGIGGFHCAMDQVSAGKAICLYASEIDKNACKIYENNFGIKPLGDIRTVDPSQYESPDIVCAGFPCQTFSKAGKQNGFKDPRGTLFKEIIRIIEFYKPEKRPKILLLENVRNLVSHDHGDTWKTIRHEIEKIGYNIAPQPIILAPKDVEVPQLRDRAIILAVRRDLFDSSLLDLIIQRSKHNTTSIFSILSEDLIGSKSLTDKQLYALNVWDEFIQMMPNKTIGFPIWSDEFGKEYDISIYPDWKKGFINKNRKLYKENKKNLDKWMKKWRIKEELIPTYRKFEWQANNSIKSVFEGIIQFRTSGIRVKRPTESPALVEMVHLPVIGAKRRTISIKEAARLQSFPDGYKFDESHQMAFKQLGNAVNVKVIVTCLEKFLKFINCKWED